MKESGFSILPLLRNIFHSVFFIGSITKKICIKLSSLNCYNNSAIFVKYFTQSIEKMQIANDDTASIHSFNSSLYNVSAVNERLNSNNHTESLSNHAPQLTRAALVRVYVLCILGIISLVGNIATIWNIEKTRNIRRNSRHTWSAIYVLILHLSIADLLVTVFCIFGEAAWNFTVEWIAGEFSCKMVKFIQMFGLYLSTYVLVLIGIDRYVAVKYPMKSLNMAKRCHHLLICAYILSLVMSLPQVRFILCPKIRIFFKFHFFVFCSALLLSQVTVVHLVWCTQTKLSVFFRNQSKLFHAKYFPLCFTLNDQQYNKFNLVILVLHFFAPAGA